MLTWISAWSGYGQTGRSVTTARPPGRPRGYRPYDGASAAAGPAAAVRAAGARGAAARGGAGGRSARTFPAWAMISAAAPMNRSPSRSEEHTSELQSHVNLVCRLLLEKKKPRNQLQMAELTVKTT